MFCHSRAQITRFGGGPLSFALPVTSQSTSLVVISAQADSVKFITNVCPGLINSMQLCQFNGLTCGGFEAGSSRGYIYINVSNLGYIPSSYTLTVRRALQSMGGGGMGGGKDPTNPVSCLPPPAASHTPAWCHICRCR